MGQTRFRSWWKKIRKPLGIISIIAVCVCAVVLVFVEVRLYGTGFVGKTLWDWLNLVGVLAVPIVVVVGGFWLNQLQKNREERTAQQRGKIEREIAEDNQREVELQAYIDKMSELLLEKELRGSAEDDEVRKVARIRTLTVLIHLDGGRKRRVLQFLCESGLIEKEKPIISLDGADLREVDLHGANLNRTFLARFFAELDEWMDDLFDRPKVHPGEIPLDPGGVALSGANLRKAVLSGANLVGADLSRTNLSRADLYRADLSYANLRDAKVTNQQLDAVESLKGAILPDGSIHP